jgi:hypothetical protein
MVSGTGASGLVATNNLFDNNPATLFANATPTTPAHFALTGGSPAIGFGVVVPVHTDFFFNGAAPIARPQGGTFDAGASEF